MGQMTTEPTDYYRWSKTFKQWVRIRVSDSADSGRWETRTFAGGDPPPGAWYVTDTGEFAQKPKAS